MASRRTFLKASTSLAVVTSSGRAFAQANWPKGPLKILIPFAPGGSSDTIARIMSKPLSDALGVPVVVENKTGANGIIAATATAQATDNSTVLLTDMGSLAINPLITPSIPYKPGDLQGVTMLAYSPHLLVLHPSVKATNLAELVALSKVKPITVASAGSGSPNHLAMAEIAMATGMKWVHVPYKGGAAALQDTIAGNTMVVLNGMLATLPMVTNGQLKCIAVSKRTRVPLLSQIPTVAEQGVPNFESGTYQGVVTATSVPKPIVERMNADMIKVIRSPEVRARLAESGAEVITMTPAETTAWIVKEQARWDSLIKKAGKGLEGNA